MVILKESEWPCADVLGKVGEALLSLFDKHKHWERFWDRDLWESNKRIKLEIIEQEKDELVQAVGPDDLHRVIDYLVDTKFTIQYCASYGITELIEFVYPKHLWMGELERMFLRFLERYPQDANIIYKKHIISILVALSVEEPDKSIIDKAIESCILNRLIRFEILERICDKIRDHYADDLKSFLDKQENDKVMDTLLFCYSKFGIEFLHVVLMYIITTFFDDFYSNGQKLLKTLIFKFANETGISQKEFEEELLAIKKILE